MSDEKLHILIRPEICDYESLPSYLERICFANYYSNTAWIRKLLDSSLYQFQNNLLTHKDFETLELLLGKCKKDLAKHGAIYWCTNLFEKTFDKYILKNRVKYCPNCFQERQIHQYPWGFNLMCICLIHQCELVDVCQQCNSKIGITDLMRGNCRECEFIYSSAKAISVSPDSYVFQSQTEIQAAMFSGTSVMNKIGGINFRDFIDLSEASFHLLEGLQSFISDAPMINNIFKKKNTKFDNSKYLLAYGNVWWMYENFPNNFNHILDVFLSKKSRSHVYTQKGQFEKVIEKYPIIKKAYSQFWVNKFDDGTVRKDLSLFRVDETLLEQRKMISREEIKEITGMTYVYMNNMVDSGKIDMKVVELGGKTRYLVDRNSLEKTLREAYDYVNKKEAALLLGIQRGSIVELIKAGILEEVKTSFAVYKKIPRQQVINLLQKCRGKPYKNTAGLISFHDALIKFSVCGLNIVRLIEFTINKKIHPKSKNTEGNLADNLYEEGQLEACVRAIKEEKQCQEGYYLTDVMKLLRIGEKKMWALINNKVLEPSTIIEWKDGRKRYLFDTDKVADILSKGKLITDWKMNC